MGTKKRSSGDQKPENGQLEKKWMLLMPLATRPGTFARTDTEISCPPRVVSVISLFSYFVRSLRNFLTPGFKICCSFELPQKSTYTQIAVL